jgi:hypothetical protein
MDGERSPFMHLFLEGWRHNWWGALSVLADAYRGGGAIMDGETLPILPKIFNKVGYPIIEYGL